MILKVLPVGPIETNCYIFGCENTMRGAVIDPGDEPKRLIEAIKESGLSIDYIFLTHCHFDHMMGLEEVAQYTGAPVVVCTSDTPIWESTKRYLLKSGKIDQARQPDVWAKEGDTFNVGDMKCTWMNTPGHTVGSSCILTGDTIFSGDTLFYIECGRCDLDTGNYSEMLKSLKRLALLEGDYAVYPGHGQSSRLSFERKHNPYMKEGLEQK